MPRQLFVKFRPIAHKLRDSWYFRMLGPKIADPRLWAVNRRAITMAFGVGIAVQFIPLPIQLPLGLLLAMVYHLNIPAMIGTTLLVNPLTAVPVYYTAYRIGALLVGHTPGPFAFELSWSWLQHGLGSVWKPFLVGCLFCGVVGGYLGYRLLELVWRISTMNRKKTRRAGVRER